jgi:hypothetical protein
MTGGFLNEATSILKKSSAHIQKVLILLLGPSKKHSSRDTHPLNFTSSGIYGYVEFFMNGNL